MKNAAVAGIMPGDALEMTPAEVNICIEAFGIRDKLEWQRAAFIAATIINPFIQKPISPAKLLEPERRNNVIDYQKAKEDYEYLKQKFGA